MTTIKMISKYASASDLLQYEAPELLEELDRDSLEIIECSDDFEPFAYYLIDQQVIVTDDITGDVIGSYDSIEDFLQDLIDSKEAEDED